MRTIPISRLARGVIAGSLALALGGSALHSQVSATMLVDPTRLQGGSPDGDVLLYTPDPVQQGSSVSHFDVSAFPNLLMEPSINSDLPFLGVDITPEQMMDIGWSGGTFTAGATLFDVSIPGEGLSDPTPFAGAPGNPAATLGQARIAVFQAALGEWLGTLASTVELDVVVLFSPLFCDPGQGAVLASAGTTFIFSDASLPVPETWYHAALTEALAGVDLTGDPAGGGGDLVVIVNSALDEGCLGAGTGYYYGLDGNPAPGTIDLTTVLLHEVAHGIGFSNFTDETTGELVQGRPGIFDRFTLDTETGLTFDQMSDAERVAAAAKPRKVAWNGSSTTTEAASVLDSGFPELEVSSPPGLAGTYEVGTAAFGPPLDSFGVSGDLACMVNVGGPFDACSPALNPAEVAGRIALVDRGECDFTTKVSNAQAAGALGAVIVNNVSNSPFTLGGAGPGITIPAVGIGLDDGAALREVVCAGVSTAVAIPVGSPWMLLLLGLGLGSSGILLLRLR